MTLLEALGELLKSLFGSKKFVAMLTSVVGWLLARVGLEVPEDVLLVPMGMIALYIAGQSYADGGKGQLQEQIKFKREQDLLAASAPVPSPPPGK